ncbi:hypothetical protein EV690_1520 [Celerinatantimonas diazotrophica]|uniref:Uncharacterized protein n=1 Tax=Celerinatantimonas diazotrophica TaxID=412034 RepID=A0A4R1K2B0_9GAMM|nr:hypothetical protein EV690_1520 [Celerinatantimonas diazotrophica]CAG9298113.1 hypothetical protein CEDIAZO_03308 [Celerinatantimonas diazotrophica]
MLCKLAFQINFSTFICFKVYEHQEVIDLYQLIKTDHR